MAKQVPNWDEMTPVQAPTPAATPPDWDSMAPVVRAQDRSFFQRNFADPFMRGKLQSLDPVLATMGLYTGQGSPEDWADALVQSQQELAQYPVTPEMQAIQERFASASESGSLADAIFQDPLDFARLVGSTVVESLPAMGVTAGAGMTGAAGGGALGSVVPLVGTGVGAVGGGVLAAGASSGAMEVSSTFNDTILSKLQEYNLPITRETLLAAAQDAEVIDEARRRAGARGAAVGAIDALSFGIAGRVGKPVSGVLAKLSGRAAPGVGQRLAGVGAELGVQGALGAGGEAAGQVAADGKITSPLDIALEGAAEIPGGALDVAGATLSRPKPKAQPAKPDQLTPEQQAAADAWDSMTPVAPAPAAQPAAVPPLPPPVEVATPPQPAAPRADPALIAGQINVIGNDPNLSAEEKVARTRELLAQGAAPGVTQPAQPLPADTVPGMSEQRQRQRQRSMFAAEPSPPPAPAGDGPDVPLGVPAAPPTTPQQPQPVLTQIPQPETVPLGQPGERPPPPGPPDTADPPLASFGFTQEEITQAQKTPPDQLLNYGETFDKLNGRANLSVDEEAEMARARRIVTIAQRLGRLSWSNAPGGRLWRAGNATRFASFPPDPGITRTGQPATDPAPERPPALDPALPEVDTPVQTPSTFGQRRAGQRTSQGTLDLEATRQNLIESITQGEALLREMEADLGAAATDGQRMKAQSRLEATRQQLASMRKTVAGIDKQLAKESESQAAAAAAPPLDTGVQPATRDQTTEPNTQTTEPNTQTTEPNTQTTEPNTARQVLDEDLNRPTNAVSSERAQPGAPDFQPAAQNLQRLAGETNPGPAPEPDTPAPAPAPTETTANVDMTLIGGLETPPVQNNAAMRAFIKDILDALGYGDYAAFNEAATISEPNVIRSRDDTHHAASILFDQIDEFIRSKSPKQRAAIFRGTSTSLGMDGNLDRLKRAARKEYGTPDAPLADRREARAMSDEELARYGELNRQYNAARAGKAEPLTPEQAAEYKQLVRRQKEDRKARTAADRRSDARRAVDPPTPIPAEVAKLNAAGRRALARGEAPTPEQNAAMDEYNRIIKARGQERDAILADDEDADPFSGIDEQLDALKDEKNPPGSLTPKFMDYALARGLSPYEQAFRDAGYDPDEARLMPPIRQMEILRSLIQNTFGFREFKLDPKANPRAAIDAMLDAYRNLQWMAHVVGMPNQGMGLNKTLALTVSDGKRTSYFGAYYPGKRMIDIKVSMSGVDGRANSFAHEWAHALDHYLAGQISGAKFSTLLSMVTKSKGLPPGLNGGPGVEAAFVDLINKLFFKDADLAFRVLKLQVEASGTRPDGTPTVEAQEAQRKLDSVIEGNAKLKGMDSQYAKNAKSFGQSAYWANPAEMLARAFEAWVANKIKNAKGNTEFVSKPDEAYLSQADARLAKTFPKDEERRTIFAAFEELFSQLRQVQMFGTEPAADAPQNYDIFDPLVWTKAAAAISDPNALEALKKEAGQYRNALGRLLSKSERGALWREILLDIKERAGLGGDRPASQAMPVWKRALWSALAFVTPVDLHMGGRIADNPKDAQPFMKQVLNQLAANPGTGEYAPETFEGEVRRVLNQVASTLEDALKVFGFDDDKRPAREARVRMRDLLLGKKVADATPAEKGIAAAIRRIYDDLYYRAREAGIEMGYVFKTGYQPRQLNEKVVFADPGKFQAQAQKVYDIVYDQEIADLDWTDLDSVFEELGKKYSYVLHRFPMLHRTIKPEVDTILKERKRILRELSKARGDEARAREALAAAKKVGDTAAEQAAAGALTKAQADQKKLDAEMEALAQEYSNILGPVWSEAAATSWLENTLRGDAMTFDTKGPDGDFAKPRTLPPEADDLLAEFYINDPFESLSRYTHDVARRIAYTKRFGAPMAQAGAAGSLDVFLATDKNAAATVRARASYYNTSTAEGRVRIIMELTNPAEHSRLEMLLTEAMRRGAVPEDLRMLRDRVEHITASNPGGPAASEMRRVTTAIHVVGTLMLMPRVAWTSFTEPLTVFLRTRSARAAFKTLGAYLAEAWKTSGVQERDQMARTMGLITSALAEGMIMQQMSGTYGDSPQLQTFLSNFYRRVAWLTPLTNAQRRAALLGSVVYFKELGRAVSGGKKVQAAQARAEFSELGIPDEHIDAFAQWVQTVDDLPALDDLTTPAGRLFTIAANRLNNQIIQGGGRVNKPVFATTPWGRVVFQLLSFAYDFTRNIHLRYVNQTVRETKTRVAGGQGLVSSAAQATATSALYLGAGFGLMIIGQLGATILREAIFNPEKWEEMEEKGELEEWLLQLAMSRSGLYGIADPLVQAATSLRYERDLTSLLAGSAPSAMLDCAQAQLNVLVGRNSENTNTAEYNAAKKAYSCLAAPAISAAATVAPGGKAVQLGTGMAAQQLTSAQTAKSVAEATVGPKGTKTNP